MDWGSDRSIYGSWLRSRCRGRGRRRSLGGPKHRIGQGDRADLARALVGQDAGVKEDDPHIHVLTGPEGLTVEAEALQLVEVDPGLGRGDVVDRLGGDRRRSAVDGAEKDLALSAGMNCDRALQGAKFPIEAWGDLAIEPHGNQPGGYVSRRRLRSLGGAAKAGRRAEQAVERNRRKGQPDHAGDHGNQQHDSKALASAARSAGRSHTSYPP